MLSRVGQTRSILPQSIEAAVRLRGLALVEDGRRATGPAVIH